MNLLYRHAMLDYLQDFEEAEEAEEANEVIHNAPIGIHFVNSDGIIIYANPFELDILGYTQDEYVGHNTGKFQIDKNALSDMMARLNRQETLTNYPVQVKAKQGVKYFLVNSSAYFKDDKFIHTRCFTANIDKSVYDVFVLHSEYYK